MMQLGKVYIDLLQNYFRQSLVSHRNKYLHVQHNLLHVEEVLFTYTFLFPDMVVFHNKFVADIAINAKVLHIRNA